MSYSLPHTVSETNQKWNPCPTLCPTLVSETHFLLGELYIPRLSPQNEGRREPGNICRKSCRLLAPCCGGTNQIAECIVLPTGSVFQLPCSLEKWCVLLLLRCTIYLHTLEWHIYTWVTLLNIHYLIAKKWSVQNQTSWTGSATPVIQHAMSRMNYVLLHIFMAHKEAHKTTKLRDFMGVGAWSSAFGYL